MFLFVLGLCPYRDGQGHNSVALQRFFHVQEMINFILTYDLDFNH